MEGGRSYASPSSIAMVGLALTVVMWLLRSITSFHSSVVGLMIQITLLRAVGHAIYARKMAMWAFF
jgi:hypothetical protein